MSAPFRPGDQVVVIDAGNSPTGAVFPFKKGAILTVESNNHGNVKCKEDNAYSWRSSRFELVTSTKAQPAIKPDTRPAAEPPCRCSDYWYHDTGCLYQQWSAQKIQTMIRSRVG